MTESARNDPEIYRSDFLQYVFTAPIIRIQHRRCSIYHGRRTEKLYDKVVKDCIHKTMEDYTNKTINDTIGVRGLAALSLLPQKIVSDVQKESTQKLAHLYLQKGRRTYLYSIRRNR